MKFEKKIVPLHPKINTVKIMEISQTNETLTAQLRGRLDTASSVQFAAEMQPLLDNADKHIVLDMTELTFISSSGLRHLLTLRKACQAAGGSITLQHVSSDVMQVLRLTGFHQLFTIEE